jgi:tRNA threonylcarbamoyladenosine modification (KEOPS) complex  Pcc1 subunit
MNNMKIEFSDKSFIELVKKDNKITISIQAKDKNNSLKKITNIVDLTIEEFHTLIKEAT